MSAARSSSRFLLYKFVIVFVISLEPRLHGNLIVAAAAVSWQPTGDCSTANEPQSNGLGVESGNGGTRLPLKSSFRLNDKRRSVELVKEASREVRAQLVC